MPDESPSGPRPPRQERSRKTLRNLEQAARELVAAHGADAVTVADVVARAGSSVGSFYARFAGKDELFRHLAGSLWSEATERWRQVFPDGGPGGDEDEVGRVAAFLVELEVGDGFLRRSLGAPGGSSERGRFLDEVSSELGVRLGEVPERVRVALRMALAALAAVGPGGPDVLGADGDPAVDAEGAREDIALVLAALLGRGVPAAGESPAEPPPAEPPVDSEGAEMAETAEARALDGTEPEVESDSIMVDPFDVWG